MEMPDIIRAAEDTLALACRHGMDDCAMGHEPIEYAHLYGMLERMREPGFSIGKANRWLGYIQGAVMAYAQVPLDELKEINRPREADHG